MVKMTLTETRDVTRWLLAGATALFLVTALITPLFPPAVQAALMAAFSPVCHQLPERSFWIAGGQVALCHRCAGIAAGLVVGLIFSPLRRSTMRPGRLAVIALAPIAVDWLLAAAGVWDSVWTRLPTGLLAGVLLGGLVARAAVHGKNREDVATSD